MSDMRDVLRAGDGGPAGALDHEAVRRRGRRLVLARIAGIALAVTVAGGLATGLVLALTESSHPTRPVVGDGTPSPGPSSESGDGSAGGADACSLPQLRPSYLPWLEAGEEVPDPVEERPGTDESPDSSLLWYDDPAAYEPEQQPPPGVSMVWISTPYRPDIEPGTEAGSERAEVRGYPADIVWIEPAAGSVSVRWRESPDPCGSYAVQLVVQGDPSWLQYDRDAATESDVGLRAIEAELLRIARSLTAAEE